MSTFEFIQSTSISFTITGESVLLGTNPVVPGFVNPLQTAATVVRPPGTRPPPARLFGPQVSITAVGTASGINVNYSLYPTRTTGTLFITRGYIEPLIINVYRATFCSCPTGRGWPVVGIPNEHPWLSFLIWMYSYLVLGDASQKFAILAPFQYPVPIPLQSLNGSIDNYMLGFQYSEFMNAILRIEFYAAPLRLRYWIRISVPRLWPMLMYPREVLPADISRFISMGKVIAYALDFNQKVDANVAINRFG